MATMLTRKYLNVTLNVYFHSCWFYGQGYPVVSLERR